MAKIKLIDIGMDDPMERLYYERQARRKKAYTAKQHRTSAKKGRRTAMVCRMGGYGFLQESSAAI